MSADRTFLGRGWRFPPDFSRAGKRADMVSGEEEVRQALRILFSTSPGERVMHPTYGCGLNRVVFDGLEGATLAEIRAVVERAVLFHEPRVQLHAVNVEIVDAEAGRLSIELEYTIRATNTRSNMVYPFYLLEATDVDVGRGRR
jgi:phage baseplate assembly protein W